MAGSSLKKPGHLLGQPPSACVRSGPAGSLDLLPGRELVRFLLEGNREVTEPMPWQCSALWPSLDGQGRALVVLSEGSEHTGEYGFVCTRGALGFWGPRALAPQLS